MIDGNIFISMMDGVCTLCDTCTFHSFFVFTINTHRQAGA
jgi:hypothetical protein